MKKGKKLINYGVIFFLLVGFPLVSFVYLRNGAEYRRQGLATIEDHGKMPSLSALPPIRGKLPPNLRGDMTVVGWLDPTKESATRIYGGLMDSLFQQFDNSENLYFTTIVLDREPEQAVAEFTERYSLPEDPMLSFLRADERTFAGTAEAFKLPLSTYDSPGSQPIVALVDSSLTIIKHYDLARYDEAIGLVQLISLIIPLPEEEDIILDRGQEL